MFALTPSDVQAMVLSAKVALTATVVALPFGVIGATIIAGNIPEVAG